MMTNTRLAVEYVTAPPLADAIDLFLQHCRARNLSPLTLRRYAVDLRGWLTWQQPHGPLLADVTIEALRAYLDYLLTEHIPHGTNPHRRADDHQGMQPETVNNIRKRIHAAWMFWGDEGMLSEHQRAFFVRGRIPSPQVPHQIRPTYTIAMLDALLAATEHFQVPETAARDRAIIILLHDTGMRVAELCAMDDAHINHSERQAIVTGKGNKQRYVFWTMRAADALRIYLALRGGDLSGPLFRSCGRGGVATKNRGGRLTTQAVRDIFERLAARAEQVLPPGATVHALRHTFAHRFLDEGGDGLHLQQLLGHTSMEATQRYVRENPTGLRRIYRKTLGD